MIGRKGCAPEAVIPSVVRVIWQVVAIEAGRPTVLCFRDSEHEARAMCERLTHAATAPRYVVRAVLADPS